MKRYDVVIIGAGSAGLAAREEVAFTTDRYLVIDPGPLGTTCARVGCMPSKAFVEVANAHHASAKLRGIGVLAESESIDRAKVMAHVRALRDRFVEGVLESQKEWETTHLLRARAKILSENLIEANGERIQADKIIVAAGTRPVVPEAWKNSGAWLETTDSFFELKDLPDQIAVIGFGPVGLELSLALARLGVDVTVFGDAKNFGGLSDPEVIKAAKAALATELTLVEGRVESVRGAGNKTELRVNDKIHSTKMVLLAMGRESRFEELGLARFPLKLDDRGRPEIDSESFRLNGTEIYLVGDLNRKKPLLHEAVDQGRIAGAHAVHGHSKHYRQRTRLTITFTSPHLAVVGPRFDEIRLKHPDFVEGKVDFRRQGRALTKMENAGLLKVYGDRKTGHLLGAEMCCPDGEHLGHLLAWALESDACVFDLLGKPFYHPTTEEGLRTALRNLSKKVERPLTSTEEMRCQDPVAGTEA